MKSKKYIIILSILIIVILVIIWIAWGNSALMVREFTIASADIPEDFSGYKIAQVSDLHNAEFGDANGNLLNLLSASEVDSIFVTGDLIDSRHTNINSALRFVKKAAEIAPVYYVTGNHESRIVDYAVLEAGLIECGAILLRNDLAELERNGQTIQLVGIDDPAFATADRIPDTEVMAADHAIKNLNIDSEAFTILLSHRPELFDVYVSNKIDLIFSGHAHGGQFRLPFIGGLAAPNQGLFPKYDSGLYSKDNTNMIVSRGLGNSIFPFRVNNRPEVVVVSLQKR